jgi:hypothetical protein
MNQPGLATVTGYAVAAVAAGLGIAVLTGLLDIDIQPTARYAFGAVLLLMGGYRFLITWMKTRAPKRQRNGRDDERRTL